MVTASDVAGSGSGSGAGAPCPEYARRPVPPARGRVGLAALLATHGLCLGLGLGLGLGLAVGVTTARAASAVPADPDLTGEWVLNDALSQPSPLPRPRPAPAGPQPPGSVAANGPVAPEDSVLPDPPARSDADAPRPVRRRPPAWLYRPERLEALRAILGEGRSLSIVQGARYVDLRTEASARTLEPGSESQVSLPTGELADQEVRWQGRRLVVERKVPRGQKVIETYERLKATDQLRVTVRRTGSAPDGLGRIEWLRVFDREDASR